VSCEQLLAIALIASLTVDLLLGLWLAFTLPQFFRRARLGGDGAQDDVRRRRQAADAALDKVIDRLLADPRNPESRE
jgi:hypothetical protein